MSSRTFLSADRLVSGSLKYKIDAETIQHDLRKTMQKISKQELEEKIIQALKNCYDPEIPVDIFELGLIYEVAIDDNNNVQIKMTLTSPMCPAAQSLPLEVEGKVKSIPQVNDVKVELVWNPPWNKDMMSEIAKLELGFL